MQLIVILGEKEIVLAEHLENLGLLGGVLLDLLQNLALALQNDLLDRLEDLALIDLLHLLLQNRKHGHQQLKENHFAPEQQKVPEHQGGLDGKGPQKERVDPLGVTPLPR